MYLDIYQLLNSYAIVEPKSYEVASRRRFELPVSRMKSWRPGPLDERDKGFLYGITLEHLIEICLF